MVFAVVEKAGTTVMMDGEELDSWSVIINGEGTRNINNLVTQPKYYLHNKAALCLIIFSLSSTN